MKSYLDEKIELIVNTLAAPVESPMEFSEILEDLRLAYDGARIRNDRESVGFFRARCKNLIIAASRAKAMATIPRHKDFCEALENVILHTLLHEKEAQE